MQYLHMGNKNSSRKHSILLTLCTVILLFVLFGDRRASVEGTDKVLSQTPRDSKQGYTLSEANPKIPPLFNGTFSKKIISTQCTTNPEVKRDNTFFEVMNGCARHLIDEWFPSTTNFYHQGLSHWIADVSQYLIEFWFTGSRYVQFCLLLLCVLPYILSVHDDQFTREMASRLAYYYFHILSLFIRISITMNIAAYLPLIFRQAAPCLCSQRVEYFDRFDVNGTTTWNLLQDYYSYPLPIPFRHSTYWRMPANEVILTTVTFLHVTSRWSYFLGSIVWLLIVPIASVISGYYSIGQVLTSLAIGVVLHFYFTETPLIMRFVDFAIHFMAGILCLFLFKNLNIAVGFENTFTQFVDGTLWTLFAFLILISIFSTSFLKVILMRRDFKKVNAIDIQFMPQMDLVPGRANMVDALKREEEGESEPFANFGQNSRTNSPEYVFTFLYDKSFVLKMVIVGFFTMFVMSQVIKYFSDDFLTFFKYI